MRSAFRSYRQGSIPFVRMIGFSVLRFTETGQRDQLISVGHALLGGDKKGHVELSRNLGAEPTANAGSLASGDWKKVDGGPSKGREKS